MNFSKIFERGVKTSDKDAGVDTNYHSKENKRVLTYMDFVSNEIISLSTSETEELKNDFARVMEFAPLNFNELSYEEQKEFAVEKYKELKNLDK